MLYMHRHTGEVRTVDGWMREYGWTEEIQFDQGSDDLIAVDESEVAGEEGNPSHQPHSTLCGVGLDGVVQPPNPI